MKTTVVGVVVGAALATAFATVTIRAWGLLFVVALVWALAGTWRYVREWCWPLARRAIRRKASAPVAR